MSLSTFAGNAADRPGDLHAHRLAHGGPSLTPDPEFDAGRVRLDCAVPWRPQPPPDAAAARFMRPARRTPNRQVPLPTGYGRGLLPDADVCVCVRACDCGKGSSWRCPDAFPGRT